MMTESALGKALQGVPVPQDIASWVGPADLPRLAVQSAETIQGLPASWRGGCSQGEAFPGPTLLALLTYAYGRGVFIASDIESLAESDPVAAGLCGGRHPVAATVLSFRRHHRDQLRSGLAGLLALAWRHCGREEGADFSAEAAGRLERAVRLDSMHLDD